MSDEDESSFLSGMKGTAGAVVALIIIFVFAPCAFCGGLATCGKVLEETDEAEVSE